MMTATFASKKIGVGFTAAIGLIPAVIKEIEVLVEQGATVIPIFSKMTVELDQRGQWQENLRKITGQEPWTTIPQVEKIGPGKLLDLFLIAPCTGNTMAKLANAITDGPVLMAAKATLRNSRPVVLGIASNDALGLNARNLGTLLAAKGIYFIPFGQDNPQEKPNSLVFRPELLRPTLEAALTGRQYQPLLYVPSR